MISSREIREALAGEELALGESLRVEHSACSHRWNDKTMNITRLEDGYVAYCHRCGPDSGSGFMDTQATGRRSLVRAGSKGAANGPLAPIRRTTDIAGFPPGVKIWLGKSQIPSRTLEQQGLRYNWTLERLEFPVEGHRETVNRHYRAGLPKYTSKVPFQLRRGGGELHDALVVVEDWLSCLQCWLAGYSSLALFTTSCPTKALMECSEAGFTRVIIALDNDNVTVKSNQRKLKRQFSLVFEQVSVVHLERDPKELTIEELQHVLES